MKTDVTQDAVERFISAVETLSKIKNKDSPTSEELRYLGVLASIRHQLKTYNLDCDAYEVVNECYLRGLRRMGQLPEQNREEEAQGEDQDPTSKPRPVKIEEIENPLGWIRVTAYRVIQEMSRKSQGKSSEASKTSTVFNSEVVDIHLETTPTEQKTPVDAVAEKEQSSMVLALLSDLKDNDGEILKLRWMDGYSWKEVAEAISQDHNPMTADTARKRGERAFKKLKEQWAEKTYRFQ